MKAYLDIVQKVLGSGFRKTNRTGVDALTIAGTMFEHDMAEGFPLLTTKKVPFKMVPAMVKASTPVRFVLRKPLPRTF